eukprot:261474-Amphidinium_carterae.1
MELKHVRRLCLHAALEKRQLSVQQLATIQQHRAKHEHAMVSSLLEALPNLEATSAYLHYIPHTMFS